MVKKSTKKKSEESKEVKTKPKGKKYLLIIPVIVIIAIVAFMMTTSTEDVAKAQLIIDSGTVQVKPVGESWTTAESGLLLYQSDTIKTGDDTSASIVLFESSVIRLDSNTEVMLEEILQEAGETSVKINQDSGRTWNTISKISGIDDYEVQTPTTVASVRGTAFDVNVSGDGTTNIGVGEGNVTVSSIENGTIIDTINVTQNESVLVDPENITDPLETKPFEKDDWVKQNQQKDQDITELGDSSYINGINVKAELYQRIDPYIPELKQQYGVSDQELEALIDGYLRGDFDLPPNTPDHLREIIELS